LEKVTKDDSVLKGTENEVLTLKADDSHVIKWHVDASFAVHEDFKSHTGATMTLGNGAIMTGSTKQKVNTRSSTETKLVGLDDYIAKVMRTRLFLDAQGYKVKDNIIYQDNKSTIQLADNGRPSIGKRSRHLNIKYFFVTDLINRKQVSIKYCPIDEMVADYMTKPLTRNKFKQYRVLIMNLPHHHSRSPKECVGIPSNLSSTIKVPTTKDTNTRQTIGNNKYHPGRSRKKRLK
jgi:hypothetical protein